MYENATYVLGMNGENTSIRIDVNGVTSYVPLDPQNADYQNIMKLVEEGKLVIQPADEQ